MLKYMTKEEELERGRIIQKYRDGNTTIKEEATKAYEELFNANMNNVYKQVHNEFKKYNYKTYGYELEDAIQDGLYELSRGIWTYDPDKNTKCYTNIYYRVQKKIKTSLNLHRPIPIKSVGSYKLIEINRQKEKYKNYKGHLTLIDYIEKNTDLKRKSIINLLQITQHLSSTDAIVNSNSAEKTYTLGDILPCPKNKFNHALQESTINLLESLTPKERFLIAYEFEINDSSTMYSHTKILEKYNLIEKEYDVEVKRILRKLKKIAKQAKKNNIQKVRG